MTDQRPSDRVRELLRGAYDTHMHISPDVVERKIDDITLARRFAELGMDGFVLKSHYGSTAERAAVVRAAVPDINDGVEVPTGNGTRRVSPGYSAFTSYAGTSAEADALRVLLSPVVGTDASSVPDVALVMMAPLARGSEVSVR